MALADTAKTAGLLRGNQGGHQEEHDGQDQGGGASAKAERSGIEAGGKPARTQAAGTGRGETGGRHRPQPKQ